MHCPHCGAPVDPGVRFCPSCRKRVVPPSEGFGNTPPLGSPAPPPPPRPAVPPPPPPAYQGGPGSGYQPQVAAALFPPYTVDLRRPGVVTVLAILNLVAGAFCMLLTAASVFVMVSGRQLDDEALPAVFLALLYGVYGLLSLAAGVGLLRMQSWGRILQIVLSCMGLLAIGCGTIVSILILLYMFKPGVKVLFSGKTAEELTPQEAADVAQLKAGGTSGIVIAIVVIVGLFVLVAIIGIIAAIAIPSLLRARISANESGAIGNLRTVISAEAAYQGANAGYYDVPACLAEPALSQCLGANAPPSPFLTPGGVVFDVPKTGYVLRFFPGETVTAAGASPSSLNAFAVVAAPASAQTGVRTFCGDSTGVVCTMSPSEHEAPGGVCPESCTPLR
jgi:type IV pilus assembly protein PilA